MGSTFPPVGELGDAAGGHQRVTHSLSLGRDPPNSSGGVIEAKVFDVNRPLGSECTSYLAKDGPC